MSRKHDVQRRGKIRGVEVEAAGLFEAAYACVKAFGRLWFYDPAANITVESAESGDVWLVSQSRMREATAPARRP